METETTYSSDRAGLMKAAQNLVEREDEHNETEPAPEPVDVPDTPPAEEKPPVSLSEWRKEKSAEKEAFAKYRQTSPDLDELALQALTDPAKAQVSDKAATYEQAQEVVEPYVRAGGGRRGSTRCQAQAAEADRERASAEHAARYAAHRAKHRIGLHQLADQTRADP